MACRLQFHMMNLIKNLLRSERNQQAMSRASFVEDLLSTSECVLNDETHFLNAAIQHVFERLVTQSISAKSLRTYLRLGTSLQAESDLATVIPLNRVKCLISTVSVAKPHADTAFVEFNMFAEGFGCIFLPSIAPQLISQPSLVAMGMVSVGNDVTVNGGVGTGERVFPPLHGMSYSTWVCIEKFGSASGVSDSDLKNLHPIRILTLIRHCKVKDTMKSCLAVYLSPKNRSLFVTTEVSFTLINLKKYLLPLLILIIVSLEKNLKSSS